MMAGTRHHCVTTPRRENSWFPLPSDVANRAVPVDTHSDLELTGTRRFASGTSAPDTALCQLDHRTCDTSNPKSAQTGPGGCSASAKCHLPAKTLARHRPMEPHCCACWLGFGSHIKTADDLFDLSNSPSRNSGRRAIDSACGYELILDYVHNAIGANAKSVILARRQGEDLFALCADGCAR